VAVQWLPVRYGDDKSHPPSLWPFDGSFIRLRANPATRVCSWISSMSAFKTETKPSSQYHRQVRAKTVIENWRRHLRPHAYDRALALRLCVYGTSRMAGCATPDKLAPLRLTPVFASHDPISYR
jgi:hypothetical protein